MAIRPAAGSAGGILFRYTEFQRLIAARTIELITALLRANTSARINPSEAIPPADETRGVADSSPGLGSRMDVRA